MSLNSLREKIDSIDNTLSALFIERMTVVKEVAKIKQRDKITLEHKPREDEILARVKTDCPIELIPYIEKFYSAIFDLSKEYQSKV